jgi:hypothetical protein
VPRKATLPAAPRVAYAPLATLRVSVGGTMQSLARALMLEHVAEKLVAEPAQWYAGSMPERITGPPVSAILTSTSGVAASNRGPTLSAAGSARSRQARPPSAEKAAAGAPVVRSYPAAYTVVKSSAARTRGASGTQPRAPQLTPPSPLPYACAAQSPVYPSGAQLAAPKQNALSRQRTRLAPPPRGAGASLHAPAVSRAASGAPPVTFAWRKLPPGFPLQGAPPAPHPAGPAANTTRYTDRDVKDTAMSQICAPLAPTKSNEPAQPASEPHNVSA